MVEVVMATRARNVAITNRRHTRRRSTVDHSLKDHSSKELSIGTDPERSIEE
jgi:hypothetical protein